MMSNGCFAPTAAVQMLVFTALEMAAYDPKRTLKKNKQENSESA